MKFLNRMIDRFCHKHRNFGIPMLMKYIVFISALTYVTNLMTNGTFLWLLTFSPNSILNGQLWRLFTWIFVPWGSVVLAPLNIIFTALALYFYYFIGTSLEREWGTAKFNLFYFFGVLLHILYGFLVPLIFGSDFLFMDLLIQMVVNPFYLNLSMLFAFAVLFPEHIIMLFFIIPIKVKWLGIANALVFAYAIFTGTLVGAGMLIILILNFLIFCGADLLAIIRPHKSRFSGNTINFKRAAKKAKRNMDSQPYRHKCAVCGKTDVDYPDMEFRYCSRCDGYHCFCQDHINNHIHF